ncbi:MAG: large subunit ribosomal protein L25 [Parcubacteria group bacterium Gr01-1014_46]|nr:MAG: large subunit ribosomal protein L25 [Parcubacteria group bacterium Gr01-1014_46]
MIVLEADIRDGSVNSETLRKGGKIPAVFYGKKTESTPISLSRNDFVSAWHKVGESGVVTIKTTKGTVDTLIKDIDIDPVSDIVRHVDFYVFEKGKKIELDVPLDFVGVAPVVKDLGGSLVKALHEIKISADPQSIPHDIKVDISLLVDFDSKILAGDLVMPAGVTLIELPTEVVAAGARPKEEEVEEVAPVDLSAIEVEKKGKKEEEGVEVAPE